MSRFEDNLREQKNSLTPSFDNKPRFEALTLKNSSAAGSAPYALDGLRDLYENGVVPLTACVGASSTAFQTITSLLELDLASGRVVDSSGNTLNGRNSYNKGNAEWIKFESRHGIVSFSKADWVKILENLGAVANGSGQLINGVQAHVYREGGKNVTKTWQNDSWKTN